VLAGYVDEHLGQMPKSWRVVRYSGTRAYGTAGGGGVNAANRHKEALWLSPYCLNVQTPDLFSVAGIEV
jgi:hypothetical protein